MANDLTLSQLLELLRDNNDLESIMNHSDEILSYSQRVDEVATDIFNRQDKEFSTGMVSLAQSMAISVMVSRGNLNFLEMMKFIHDKNLNEYAVILIKMAVGMSAMEELR